MTVSQTSLVFGDLEDFEEYWEGALQNGLSWDLSDVFLTSHILVRFYACWHCPWWPGWVVFIRFLHCKIILPPLSTVSSLEGSHYVQPTLNPTLSICYYLPPWTVKRCLVHTNARYEICLGETREKELVTACGSTQAEREEQPSWSTHVAKSSHAARNQSKSGPWDDKLLGVPGIEFRFTLCTFQRTRWPR